MVGRFYQYVRGFINSTGAIVPVKLRSASIHYENAIARV